MYILDETQALSILEARKAGKHNISERETIEAALYLAKKGSTHDYVLGVLSAWTRDGARCMSGGTPTHMAEIGAQYYYEVVSTFARLAQTKSDALNFLTDEIIGHFRWSPHVEVNGLFEVFFLIDPQQALPETRECINRILRSEIGDWGHADDFRRYKGRLPKKSVWDFFR